MTVAEDGGTAADSEPRPATSSSTTSSSSTNGTTGPLSDDGSESTGELREGCFVAPMPDVGDITQWCTQPELTAQAPGCGDGVLAAGELCYRGLATRCEVGGYGGFAVADFGNGRAIGYAAEFENVVHLLPATRAGLLGAPCPVEDVDTHAWSAVAARDVDADGRPDLLLMPAGEEDTLVVLRNHHPVVFEPWTTSLVPEALELRFLELDGIPPLDLIGHEFVGSGQVELRSFIGSSDGTFAEAATASLGLGVVIYDIADLDGDGIDEIIALVRNDPRTYDAEIQIVYGGLENPPITIEDSSVGYPGPPVAGRFDGDGVPDLAYTLGGHLLLRFGLGDGTFGPPLSTSLAPAGHGLAGVDVDADGRDELVGSRDVISFTPEGVPWIDAQFDVGYDQYGLRSVEVIDFNDDGLLDFVFFSGWGQAPPSIHLVISNP